MSEESYIVNCPQCTKIFSTKSNLKRHMENPNIHNIPYARSRDQKRWKDHSKQLSSRQETTERMRKWRAENKDKNKRNDLRCRVYRLARQKFGESESEEKERFIQDEINRRLNRRMILDQKRNGNPILHSNENKVLNELPFYSAPLQKIELPFIQLLPTHQVTTEPSNYINKSSQPSSPLIDHRRQSISSLNSCLSNQSQNSILSDLTPKSTSTHLSDHPTSTLPPIQFLFNTH